MPVFDSEGKALSIKQLVDELKRNVVPASEENNPNPVGVVSSNERGIWADLYAQLKGTLLLFRNHLLCAIWAIFYVCYLEHMHKLLALKKTGFGGIEDKTLSKT